MDAFIQPRIEGLLANISSGGDIIDTVSGIAQRLGTL
jgi:hypothetical protein